MHNNIANFELLKGGFVSELKIMTFKMLQKHHYYIVGMFSFGTFYKTHYHVQTDTFVIATTYKYQ